MDHVDPTPQHQVRRQLRKAFAYAAWGLVLSFASAWVDALIVPTRWMKYSRVFRVQGRPPQMADVAYPDFDYVTAPKEAGSWYTYHSIDGLPALYQPRGFPFASMYTVYVLDLGRAGSGKPDPGGGYYVAPGGGIEVRWLEPSRRPDWPVYYVPRALPIRPSVGLIENAAFWGAALFGVNWAGRRLVAARRLAQGRCGACGYGPFRGSICPECSTLVAGS